MVIPKLLDALIFDMDGTLLDTERLSREATFITCAQLGFEMTSAQQLSLVGNAKEDEDAKLIGYFGSDFPLDIYYSSCRSKVQKHCEMGVPLKNGARELLHYLCERNIPVGVATSTSREETLIRLLRAGVAELFDVVVTRTDVSRGKPHPETFLAAAKELGVRPQYCLAVEDSYLGVRAAVAAGMPTIMIPDLLKPTAEMYSSCAAILPGLKDLHAILRGEMSRLVVDLRSS